MPPESPLFFGMHPNAEIDFRTKMWPGWYQLDMPGRNHRFQKVQWVRHVNFAPGYGWIWHIWHLSIYAYMIYIYIYICIYMYIYDIYPPNSESLGRFISWLMLAHCTTLQVFLQIADLAPATKNSSHWVKLPGTSLNWTRRFALPIPVGEMAVA